MTISLEQRREWQRKAIQTRNGGMPGVPRDRFLAFLEKEAKTREGACDGMTMLALEIDAAAGRHGMLNKRSTGLRMLHRVRKGFTQTRHYGRAPFEEIPFDTADKILCAIDRVDAWHTEFADIYERSAA